MFENKYGKFITIMLVLLIVLIIGILVYLGFSVIKSFNLDSDGRDAAEKFENQFLENTQSNTQSNSQVNDVIPDIAPENDIFNNGGNTSSDKVQTYKGFPMVGTIEIPKINLKCPVLEKASSDAIEVAVGIYAGPGLNKVRKYSNCWT